MAITLPLHSRRLIIVRIVSRFRWHLRRFEILNEEQLVEMSHRLYRSVLDAHFWPEAVSWMYL